MRLLLTCLPSPCSNPASAGKVSFVCLYYSTGSPSGEDCDQVKQAQGCPERWCCPIPADTRDQSRMGLWVLTELCVSLCAVGSWAGRPLVVSAPTSQCWPQARSDPDPTAVHHSDTTPGRHVPAHGAPGPGPGLLDCTGGRHAGERLPVVHSRLPHQ